MYTHVPHECLPSLVFSCLLATGGKPSRERDKSTVTVLVFRVRQAMAEDSRASFSPGISGTHLVFVLVDHRHIYSGDIEVSEKDGGWRSRGRGQETKERREKVGRREGRRRSGGERGGGRRGGRGGGRGQETKERREGGKERRKEEGENDVTKLEVGPSNDGSTSVADYPRPLF